MQQAASPMQTEYAIRRQASAESVHRVDGRLHIKEWNRLQLQFPGCLDKPDLLIAGSGAREPMLRLEWAQRRRWQYKVTPCRPVHSSCSHSVTISEAMCICVRDDGGHACAYNWLSCRFESVLLLPVDQLEKTPQCKQWTQQSRRQHKYLPNIHKLCELCHFQASWMHPQFSVCVTVCWFCYQSPSYWPDGSYKLFSDLLSLSWLEVY